jgi:hypothetical protein
MNFEVLKRHYKKFDVRRLKYQRAANLIRLKIRQPLLENVAHDAIRFTETLRVPGTTYGQYRFAKSINQPVLYASIFAALVRHLTDDIKNIADPEKTQWIEYILSFQCSDGLFRDPRTTNDIAETEDWWGWRHLAVLTSMALSALGAKPRYRLSWLDELARPNAMVKWLDQQDWDERVDFTSNAVQNRIACMQFSRDSLGENSFSPVVKEALEYLSAKCNSATGLWGRASVSSSMVLTRQVQAAYHFWLLYLYDSVDIPHRDRAIDNVLRTQSWLGGYSPVSRLSSACEDIDSIDPIVRFGLDVHRVKCLSSLRRASAWVLFNFNPDGGAVFRRDQELVYGHALMSSASNESNIFATWFRLLSLALIDNAKPVPNKSWSFLKAPGYQFGPEKRLNRA